MKAQQEARFTPTPRRTNQKEHYDPSSVNVAMINFVNSQPPVEVPPCLSLQQYLEITETQPDP